MGKTRVHELAKKLELDENELLQKLGEIGIEVNDRMSILVDEDVQELEAAQSAQKVKIEEQRINPGIIRRRKKAFEPVAEVEEPVAETPAEDGVVEASAEVAAETETEAAPVVDETSIEEPVVDEAAPVEEAAPKAEPSLRSRARIVPRSLAGSSCRRRS